MMHFYRLLLLLYPRDHREAWGDEMMALFTAQLADARSEGRVGRFWITILTDTLHNATREHLDAGRYAAWAAVGGGLMWAWGHSPWGLGHFWLPPLALALMLIGVVGLFTRYSHDPWALPGVILAAAGLIAIAGSYVAAWLFMWRQTGVPVLVGFALLSSGMLLLSVASLRFTVAGVAFLSAAPMVPLLIAVVLGQAISLLGLLIPNIAMGVMWSLMGISLLKRRHYQWQSI